MRKRISKICCSGIRNFSTLPPPTRESLKSRLKVLEGKAPTKFTFKRKVPLASTITPIQPAKSVIAQNPRNSLGRKPFDTPAIQSKPPLPERHEVRKQKEKTNRPIASDNAAVDLADDDVGQENVKKGRMTPKMLKKEREREKREKLALKQERLRNNDSRLKKEKAGKKAVQKTIHLQEGVTVNNLASLLDVSLRQLQNTMVNAGFEQYPSDYVLNSEVASLLVMEYNMVPIVTKLDTTDLIPRDEPKDWSQYPLRPPVITIMGHVDHGKTTLLDALRKTSVAAGEAGGITQHIGAFSVQLPPPSNKLITFLDTPGHAAFSHMRQRGARVTDIVVLVVAADDGVMPQTKEAIQHAIKAEVPIIVAINKCDKPGVNPEKIKQDLLRYEIVVEEMGGEVPSVHISGKTGLGLQELEETILALAEVADYRGDPTGSVEGIIVESKHSKQFGNVATMIVKRGTLEPGAILVAGQALCKVKRMVNENGKTLKSVGPSGPVEVLGWKELPQAGDLVLQSDTEGLAKRVVLNRKRKEELEESLKAIEDINEKRSANKAEITEAKVKAREENQRYRHNLSERKQEAASNECRVVLKGDVHGSVEAIEGVINELPNHEVYCNIVSSGVGAVTESDVEFARVTDATIFAFNVPVHRSIQNLAEENKVNISHHSIIYTLVDAIKEKLSNLLAPEVTINIMGEATVQALFPITVKKKITETIAGCKILSGKVTRQNTIRVIRNGKVHHEGKIKTFKHHKKDILEASKGLECGINVESFEDIMVGDIIQSITTTSVKRTFA